MRADANILKLVFDFSVNLVSGDNWGKGFVERKGGLTKCASVALIWGVKYCHYPLVNIHPQVRYEFTLYM